MNESLRINQSVSGPRTTLRLIGQIDEDADYTGPSLEAVDKVIFDFSGVTLVNSTGLQKWIAFLGSIPRRLEIEFEKCPPRIVKQIDMFPGFLAERQVIVSSFFAPYYCAACDKAEDVLLKTADLQRRDQAPAASCGSCSAPMEFDAIEKKYFLFLERMQSPG